MTIGVADPVFVDTNILVFSTVPSAPPRAAAQAAIRRLAAAGVELWISRQVIREYLATLSRPQTYAQPQPPQVLAHAVSAFLSTYRVAEDSADVTNRLLTLIQQVPVGGKQIHDANIVATMQAYGIRRLLTDNGADFARYGRLVTVLPL